MVEKWVCLHCHKGIQWTVKDQNPDLGEKNF